MKAERTGMSAQAGDARFEDGAEEPLRLRAETAADLAVISALVQDAVAHVADVAWAPRRRRLSLLVNRFRWEDAPAAERQGRPFERVRAVLTIAGALRVQACKLNPHDRARVISLLSLAFDPDEDGGGVLRLALADGCVITVATECLDVTLEDVSRPYLAPTGKAPRHPA